MKYILYLFLLLQFCFGAIVSVPDDFDLNYFIALKPINNINFFFNNKCSENKLSKNYLVWKGNEISQDELFNFIIPIIYKKETNLTPIISKLDYLFLLTENNIQYFITPKKTKTIPILNEQLNSLSLYEFHPSCLKNNILDNPLPNYEENFDTLDIAINKFKTLVNILNKNNLIQEIQIYKNNDTYNYSVFSQKNTIIFIGVNLATDFPNYIIQNFSK